MIPRETIDQVMSAARIEEVVSEYVTLKRRGANLIGLCPFHNEKTGSFTVSPAKGIYKCFGCGKSGHAVGFVMDVEQCSYADAIRKVAARYHIEVPEREQTPEEKQRQDDRESMLAVNQFTNEWYQSQLWNTPEGKMAGLGYLVQQRGLREDIIRRFGLGYSPERSGLSEELRRQGFRERFVLNDVNEPHIGTGVCCKSQDGRSYDRFHGRVIFPFYSTYGKCIGFAGRILKPKDNTGKYVNSPTSPLFEKKNELYGFYQAKSHIQRKNMCYLVEGQLDVISMVQAGVENVVSSGGTSLTPSQIKLIHRFTPNVTIIYDGDKAGVKAALRGIDMVLAEGMSVKMVLLPEGMDPDEFARSRNADELVEYIKMNSVDFIRFKSKILLEDAGRDPQKLADLINDVVASIAKIPDVITRQVYLRDTAEQLHISEDLLNHRLKDCRFSLREELTKQIEEEKKREEMRQTQQQATASQDDDPLEENLRNLLRLLVRYGDQPLGEDEGRIVTLGEYLVAEVRGDGVQMPRPIYDRFFDEFMAHYQESGFVSERFFTYHSDLEISRMAVSLMTDKYQLSALFDGQQDEIPLMSLVVKVLMEMRLTIVNRYIADWEVSLKAASEAGDWEQQKALMAQQPHLFETRNQICKTLGIDYVV